MTVENGGSLAQAQVHNQIRIDILQDDARQLANTIQRDLIDVFVGVNFGAEAKSPKVVLPVAEPQDVAALAGALALTVPLGLRSSKARCARNSVSPSPRKATSCSPRQRRRPVPTPATRPATTAWPTRRSTPRSYRLGGCPCCGETRPRHAVALNATVEQEDEVEAIGADEPRSGSRSWRRC